MTKLPTLSRLAGCHKSHSFELYQDKGYFPDSMNQSNRWIDKRWWCDTSPTTQVCTGNFVMGLDKVGMQDVSGAMSQCANNMICLLQPQCASLRVHDCSRLMHEAGRDAVLRDEVCAAQCSNILLSSPGPSLEALEDIVSLTTRKPSVRARDFLPTNLIPPPLSIRRPSLRSFKLSDIFLGQWNVTRVSKIWQPCFLKLS